MTAVQQLGTEALVYILGQCLRRRPWNPTTARLCQEIRAELRRRGYYLP